MESDLVLRTLRRGWAVVVAGTIFGALLCAAYSLARPPSYIATAQLYISTNAASSISDLSQGATFTQDAVRTFARLATTPLVLNQVAKQSDVQISERTLSQSVTADPLADTSILEISATSGTPSLAVATANGVTRQLAEVAPELTPTTSTKPAIKLTQVQDASTATHLAGPSAVLLLAAGALSGLASTVLVLLLRGRFDTRIRNQQDVEFATDAPVVGSIPFDRNAASDPLIALRTSHNREAESFRSLRTNFKYLRATSDGNAFVITSSLPGEGKTTTTTNLAIALAESGESVLLIDADLRRPRVAQLFGLDGSLGLSEVLTNQITVEKATQNWGEARLDVIPAGSIPPNPSELLGSLRFTNMIADQALIYDVILIDAPPVLAVTDGTIIAADTAGALVVVQSRRVKLPEFVASIAGLQQAGARIQGIILTQLQLRPSDAYGYDGYGQQQRSRWRWLARRARFTID